MIPIFNYLNYNNVSVPKFFIYKYFISYGFIEFRNYFRKRYLKII